MVSVIVPVYNVKDYLRACVESVLQSSYHDLEVILIDDGSTDGSGTICDEFASRDERIRVIHKQNGGVSSARNMGLDSATGEYVSFVDGDDVIHPQMIEILVNAIKQGDNDFSMCYVKRVDKESAIETAPVSVVQSDLKLLSRQDYVDGLYHSSYIQLIQYCMISNKLYHRDLVESDYFSELRSGEDTEWIHRVCLKMKRAILVEKELYYYIQRSTSVTHVAMNPVFFDRIKAYRACLSHIPVADDYFRAKCLNQLYKTMVATRFNCLNTPYLKEAATVNAEVYKETISDFLHSRLSLLKKVKYLLFYHCPWTYRLFMQGCDWVARFSR